MVQLTVIVEALRPLHWVKSGFCLAALFLGGYFFEQQAWIDVLPMLVAMSLLSSSGYLFNDICNRDEDAQHPRKKRRAVASGRLSIVTAKLWATGVLFAGIGILLLGYGFSITTWVGLSYLLVSFSYNLVLRGIPLVDVLVLSLGFVVRVAAGSLAIGLDPSIWLLICTYTVSLLLGFGKRRGEFFLIETGGKEIGGTRSSLRGYNMMLLDALLALTAVMAVVAYVFYVMTNDSLWSRMSIAPVVVGVSEYMRWAWRSEWVEVPEKLLGRSPVLLGAVVVWVLLIVVAGL